MMNFYRPKRALRGPRFRVPSTSCAVAHPCAYHPPVLTRIGGYWITIRYCGSSVVCVPSCCASAHRRVLDDPSVLLFLGVSSEQSRGTLVPGWFWSILFIPKNFEYGTFSGTTNFHIKSQTPKSKFSIKSDPRFGHFWFSSRRGRKLNVQISKGQAHLIKVTPFQEKNNKNL